MTPFTRLIGVAAPLLKDNVDTDAIIPSREMKTVSKVGLAGGLFAGWRYTEVGGREPQADFVLNRPMFAGAQVLLSGANFGCGSSREHAVWALAEYGFRAVIAASFNPIFRNNCVRNGVAPVVLARDAIASIAAEVEDAPQIRLVTVDLESMAVTAPGGETFAFGMGEEDRAMLLEGLDPIDLTLKLSGKIAAFRDLDRSVRPWIYL